MTARPMQHRSGWPVSYGSYCRGCRCAGCAEKQRAYYEANKDEIAEKKRAYREANKDEIAEKQRAYYEANKDEIAEKQRAYRAAHPELQIYYREHARRRAKGLPTKGLMADLRANGMLNTDVVSEWVAIEQAIARGESTSRIMTDLAVPYEVVQSVREAMDGAA